MKKPVYEVKVIATVDNGMSYHTIKVLTLDSGFEVNNYEKLEVVGYIEVEGEQE